MSNTITVKSSSRPIIIAIIMMILWLTAKFAKDAVVEDGAADRSLAVRLTLNNDEASLTEDQIETAVKAVVDQLSRVLGARQRV